MKIRRHLPDDRSMAWFAAGLMLGVGVSAWTGSRRTGVRRLLQRLRQRAGDLSDFMAVIDGAIGDDTPDSVASDAADEDEGVEPDSAATLVLDRFSRHGLLSRRPIEIASPEPGVIELTGHVRRKAEAALAEEIAREVEGVSEVVNRIKVRTPAPRPPDA